MRLRAAVSLLLVAGCGHAAPATRPSPTPSATTTPSPAAPVRAVVVAADRGKAGVTLYTIGADRHATEVVTVPPPSGTSAATDVSLSSGATPDVCVAWSVRSEERTAQLWCYAYGSTTGHRIPTGVAADGTVALRADGRALAWTEHPSSGGRDDQAFVVADYRDGTVSGERRRATYSEDGTASRFGCDGTWVVGAAWIDARRLLLECNGENDDPGGLAVQDATSPAAGRHVPDQDVQPPYNYLRQARSADGTTALALQGEWCEIECPGGKPRVADRAVRVDLATGRVVEVVATPAPGRGVVSVSGGARGVVYVTEGDTGTRTYLRLPGEAHGTIVAGLADDVKDVVAQP